MKPFFPNLQKLLSVLCIAMKKKLILSKPHCKYFHMLKAIIPKGKNSCDVFLFSLSGLLR